MVARKNEDLERELKVAKKAIARIKETVRGNRKSQGTKRETAEKRSSIGSGDS